jgi:hypothetical protein
MQWKHREPTLEDILAEPIVGAIMEADRVDRLELAAMLGRVARVRRAANAAPPAQSIRSAARDLF